MVALLTVTIGKMPTIFVVVMGNDSPCLADNSPLAVENL